MKADVVYCAELGGLIDRNEIVVLEDVPPVGARVCVAPSDKVTRALWGATGTVTRHRVDTEDPAYLKWTRTSPTQTPVCFIEFDNPRVSVGALMSGVWLPPDKIMA